MKKLPELLGSRLKKRQCVAFVGAGFSMACGMPGWDHLLSNVISNAESGVYGSENIDILKACREAIKQKKYTVVADMIRNLLMTSDFDEYVRSQFSLNVFHNSTIDAKKQMTSRMEKLATSPWAGIITTNYDELIEYALEKWTTLDVVKSNGADPRLGSILCNSSYSQIFFVKIHGSISGSNIVLGTDEYDRTYINTPQIISFLTAVMLRYHIIFIGCSLEDEIIRLRRKLNNEFQGLIPTAYAILEDNDENRSRVGWLKSYAQVDCFLFSNNDKKYQYIENFLMETAVFADPKVTSPYTSNTIDELYKLDAIERISQIGAINKMILEYLLSQDNKTIRHNELIDLNNLNNPGVDQALLEMSPDEKVYRVLFLAAIGLVDEKEVEGSHIYSLSTEGERAIKSLIK